MLSNIQTFHEEDDLFPDRVLVAAVHLSVQLEDPLTCRYVQHSPGISVLFVLAAGMQHQLGWGTIRS